MRFISFKYLSETEVTIVLRETGVDGAIDIAEWTIDRDALWMLPGSLESFLSCYACGIFEGQPQDEESRENRQYYVGMLRAGENDE